MEGLQRYMYTLLKTLGSLSPQSLHSSLEISISAPCSACSTHHQSSINTLDTGPKPGVLVNKKRESVREERKSNAILNRYVTEISG